VFFEPPNHADVRDAARAAAAERYANFRMLNTGRRSGRGLSTSSR